MREMTFGEALEALKQGKKVARTGWNGKGMHLLLINGNCIHNAITECYGNGIPEHTPKVLDSIAMYTAQKTLVVGWLVRRICWRMIGTLCDNTLPRPWA